VTTKRKAARLFLDPHSEAFLHSEPGLKVAKPRALPAGEPLNQPLPPDRAVQ
jgi:hypothetical protein